MFFSGIWRLIATYWPGLWAPACNVFNCFCVYWDILQNKVCADRICFQMEGKTTNFEKYLFWCGQGLSLSCSLSSVRSFAPHLICALFSCALRFVLFVPRLLLSAIITACLCYILLLPVFVIWISALFYLIVLFFISASCPESCLWALFCKPWQVTSTHNIPVRKPTDVKCLLFPFMVFSGCFLVSWQCSLCFPPVLLPPPDFPFTPSLHQCN